MPSSHNKAVDHGLRQTNTGRLLLRAMRAFNERSMAAVQESGHPALSFAHASILPHIDADGTRLTEIAERAGMRKQSASQLIGELEKAGYVARTQDLSDKRATLISFTPQGQNFLRDAATVKARIEEELKRELGAGPYETLRTILVRFPGVSGG
ncbi:MarR family winged helix-turn-helix transcriptional regulator [Microvirga sp. 2MCAF38]|uniref:MarR family winged helix-turn-helix transcriptional regulator n=1 Tax=Microvirga sp. 2MCAF38 TaxID=3232989 RepID=UPI003F9D1D0C